MSTYPCPNGHASADPEWCDTCGAPIGGPAGSSGAPPAGASTPAPPGTPSSDPTDPGAVGWVACPHCGSMNEADHLFCESCGYDFTTGQTPDPAPPTTPPPVAAEPDTPAPSKSWIVVIEVDPAWFALKGELADQACPSPSTSTVTVTQRVALIGRTSASRGLRPEIALDVDLAVSRRHAQLLLEGDQVSIVDLSSTNGTYVLGGSEAPTDELHPIAPGVPAVLHDADRIYLGAWTRLTVRVG